jgi:hypothetical protein
MSYNYAMQSIPSRYNKTIQLCFIFFFTQSNLYPSHSSFPSILTSPIFLIQQLSITFPHIYALTFIYSLKSSLCLPRYLPLPFSFIVMTLIVTLCRSELSALSFSLTVLYSQISILKRIPVNFHAVLFLLRKSFRPHLPAFSFTFFVFTPQFDLPV